MDRWYREEGRKVRQAKAAAAESATRKEQVAAMGSGGEGRDISISASILQ